MVFTIESIEDTIVRLEDEQGAHICIDINLMPTDASEGSVLYLENGKYYLDEVETENRRKRIIAIRNRLLRK